MEEKNQPLRWIGTLFLDDAGDGRIEIEAPESTPTPVYAPSRAKRD